MNDRQLPASALRRGLVTWLQVLVAGVLTLAGGRAAQADRPLNAISVAADPIAPPPAKATDPTQLLPGTGLCGAYRQIGDTSFIQNRTSLYPGNIYDGTNPFYNEVNDFMDGKNQTTMDGPVNYQTLRTAFDLADPHPGLGRNTVGDFISPACGLMNNAGCPFPGSPTSNMSLPQFLGRFRGFFLVTNELAGQFIHFGFTANSAVALRFYPKLPSSDKSKTPYELINREPGGGGVSDWRTTNVIQFQKPGLYAVEILYVGATSGAARLEMAVSTQNITDVDQQFTDPAGVPLSLPQGGNYVLTTPEQFFQKLDGTLPFPSSIDACQQCPRGQAYGTTQKSPTNGCPTCMACNEAAVCQVCNTPDHCGCADCGPCDKMKAPYCIGDPTHQETLHCVQCVTDAQCPGGQNCINNSCVGFCPCCDSPKTCIGYTKATDPDADPAKDANKWSAKYCSACASDGDCPNNGKCDLKNARCVDKVPDHNSDKDCGTNGVNCITTTMNDHTPRPFCLNGEVCVQCRFDFDCDRGNYCRSGDCIPCTDDRHCGPSCGSCGVSFAFDANGMMSGSTTTSTPVCYAPAAPNEHDPAPTPTCVECLADAHCGTGGTCDLSTHKCAVKIDCPGGCPDGQVCNGGSCVGCVTSSQCRCGTCTAGICTPSCGDSTDCMSNQCCAKETSTCVSGRCKPGLTAHGGALCCEATAGAVGGAEDPGAPVRSRAPLWSLLMALAMLAALQLRARRAAGSQRSRE